MKIQIWGKSKCFDTKKAERYFKERRIKVQFIDLKEKEMSKGELTSVMQAVGGIDKLLNPKAKDEETLALIQHLTPSQRLHWWIGRRRTSCSRISSSSKRPSCATAKRPPSAIVPTYGEPGSSLCYLPVRGYKSRRLA